MSKRDVWMPLHIGDYLADTMRLTTVQHGAYLLLLMQYWKSGPLPDDDDELGGIAKMDAKSWAKISASIRRFFIVGEDGLLHQKRADEERAKAADISTKRALAVAQRADRKPSNEDQGGDNGPTNEATNVERLNPQKKLQLNTHARAELQPPKDKEKKEDNRSLRSLPQNRLTDGFDDWWNAYPRKVGKDAARKAYAAALKRGVHPDDLTAAVLSQRWNDDRQYIPHPATWLNGGRWQDDPDAAAPPPAKATSTHRNGFFALGDMLDQADRDAGPTIEHEGGHHVTRH